jgi:hypothetical protein
VKPLNGKEQGLPLANLQDNSFPFRSLELSPIAIRGKTKWSLFNRPLNSFTKIYFHRAPQCGGISTDFRFYPSVKIAQADVHDLYKASQKIASPRQRVIYSAR